jgi:hypothetical protein
VRTVALASVSITLLAGLAVALALPSLVRARLEAAADARGLSLTEQHVSIGWGSAALTEVVLHPKGTERALVRASRVDAKLAGLSPVEVTIPSAAFELKGTFDEVETASGAIAAATAKASPTAATPLVPVKLEKGTLVWTGPLGTASKLKVASISASLTGGPTFAEATATASFSGATLSAFPLRIPDARGTWKRVRGQDSLELTIAPESAGKAVLRARRDGDGGEVGLELEALSLEPLRDDDGMFPIDLKSIKLDGESNVVWTSEGAVALDVALESKITKLPALTLGGVKVQLSGEVKLAVHGKAKKGTPWTTQLSDGELSLTLFGQKRTLKLTGDVAWGERLAGPRRASLEWSLSPIACADLVGLASAAIPAIPSKAVTGEVTVTGKISGDPLRPSTLKSTTHVEKSCAADLIGALGSLGLSLP